MYKKMIDIVPAGNSQKKLIILISIFLKSLFFFKNLQGEIIFASTPTYSKYFCLSHFHRRKGAMVKFFINIITRQ